MDLEGKEALLRQRLQELDELEARVQRREQALKTKENAKKQVPLRLSAKLWNEVAALAEADFRSINGEIEYLLTEAVRRRKG